MFFSGKSPGVVRIVVFLGNPGRQYAGTRHNVGFAVADEIEKSCNLRINKLRFGALTARCVFGGEKVLLMKPQTYMNLSGRAVLEAARYFKLPPHRVIVISDDIELPPAKLRIRTKGSDGGHNGLKSIISALGSDEFPRIRIGVGRPEHPEYDTVDWVLGSFSHEESALMAIAVRQAADAAEIYIRDGADAAMSKFN